MGAITKHQDTAALAAESGYTESQVDLIKRTIAEGATNDELQLFMHVSKRMQLDPFARQIYAVKRWDSARNCNVMSIQVGIDGFRLTADRTGKYAGQVGPQWCGEDGVWKDVWLSRKAPSAARVGVLRVDFKEPLWAVARFDAYAQTKKDGSLTMMWATKGDIMIAKCAESLALRKAFPAELSGVYSSEEMEQADNPATAPATRPRPALAPAAELPPHNPQTGEAIDAECDPADFVLQTGKNAGKRLGDLDGRSLSWYAEECRNTLIRDKAQAVRENRRAEKLITEAAERAKLEANDGWGLSGGEMASEAAEQAMSDEGAEAEAEAMAAEHDR